MSKRLSDTEALSSQSLKPAGNEYASSKSPYDEGIPCTPAYGSADCAVESKELRERLYNPVPYIAPSERAEYRRETGAGNSALSTAVKYLKD